MYILLSENLQYFPSEMSTHKQSGHRHEKTRSDKHTRNSPIQKPHQGLKYCIYNNLLYSRQSCPRDISTAPRCLLLLSIVSMFAMLLALSPNILHG